MAFDIYSTGQLLACIQAIDPADSFLRDRYFPSNAADIFSTEKVLVEYRDGDRRLAPFVSRRANGFGMDRMGAEMHEYLPPTVAPKRAISIDDITKRGFGEAILGDQTPQQRARVMAMRDLSELDAMVSRREEAMAAEVMTTNGCVMKALGDDAENAAVDEVHFYDDDEGNQAAYSVTTKWDADGAKIYDDLAGMADILTTRGLPASEFVCSPDVAQAIVKDPTIQEILDNRRYEMGNVDPRELNAMGAALVCTLNVYGNVIDVISYNARYRADDGTFKPYISAGTGVLTAPGAGRTLYGAVTQVEQADGMFHTYSERRVPKYVASAENDVRTLTLTSRPILVPNDKDPWVSASSLLTA